MSQHPQNLENKSNFNVWLTNIFLKNSRLTILSLLLLIVIGVFTLSLLKTTGFPNPKVSVLLVQTVYPGASSEIVNKEVTIPIESAIKGISDVENFNSTSNNSFSNVIVTLNEKADSDLARNKIDSAIKSTKLPKDVQNTKISNAFTGDPDIYLVVTNKDIAKVYDNYKTIQNKLQEDPSVVSVSAVVELKKNIIITPNISKLSENNISQQQLSSGLSSFGESIPALSGISLDNKKVGITTSIPGSSLDSLKNLNISSNSDKVNKLVPLSDLVDFSFEYKFDKNENSDYSFYNEKTSSSKVVPAVTLKIEGPKNADKGVFTKNVEKVLENISSIEYVSEKDISSKFNENTTYAVNTYSVSEENKKQVDEIIGGIVGSKIGNSFFGNIGYLLGGIQLVILVMMAFVSWRAALIAATAIPLSVIFSTIYVYLIGENLNTLVLFSLVLVLGLVVDPALVVLEAIQRKIDSGLKGNHAILEAIKDVGYGVFLAALTNIIVFLPFGILSGFLGEIFRYIPLTIIPAVVGSYFVPIIFLSWMAGITLKPNKKAKDDEEENLWPLAKWLIAFNHKIANSSRLLRAGIIIFGLVFSIGLSSVMFSSGAIKQVQFASSDNTSRALLSGSFLPSITLEEQKQTTQKVLDIINSNKNVISSTQVDSSFRYYVSLKDKADRSEKSKAITSDINDKIQKEFGDNASSDKRKFFDVSFDVVDTGPPTDAYQLTFTVKDENPGILKNSSVKISKNIEDHLCLKDNKVSMADNCDAGDKIIIKTDDGYSLKDNLIYDVQVNRDALLLSGSNRAIQGPLTGQLNSLIKSQFIPEDEISLTTVKDSKDELNVYLRPDKVPTTIDQLQSNVSKTLNLPTIDGLAKVVPTTPATSIQRVRGQTVNLVKAKLKKNLQNNQTVISEATQVVEDYYANNNFSKTSELGLDKGAVTKYADSSNSSTQKTFTELLIALLVAIFASYMVLAIFFNSLTQPLGILYTIPLSFVGVFPALYFFGGGQFGFFEIIGIIILVGIVENVAIFLLDAANQKIKEGWEEKRAISYASGVRMRPVLLTSVTAFASLTPLAIASDFYRSIAVVIMFGILVSGVLSLITTPILFVFFKWSSKNFQKLSNFQKLIFYPLMPFYLAYWTFKYNKKESK